jgi:hypothetical protein
MPTFQDLDRTAVARKRHDKAVFGTAKSLNFKGSGEVKRPQRGCRGQRPPAAGAGRKRLQSPLKAVLVGRKTMAQRGCRGQRPPAAGAGRKRLHNRRIWKCLNDAGNKADASAAGSGRGRRSSIVRRHYCPRRFVATWVFATTSPTRCLALCKRWFCWASSGSSGNTSSAKR